MRWLQGVMSCALITKMIKTAPTQRITRQATNAAV